MQSRRKESLGQNSGENELTFKGKADFKSPRRRLVKRSQRRLKKVHEESHET